MASIYQLKPAFQGLLRPIANVLARTGVTANAVTLAAAGFSMVWGMFFLLYPESSWPLLALPAFLFFRMALNAIDGIMAREHNQQTRLGAILNELGDVVSDAALYLPLAVVAGFHSGLVVVIVVLSVISEMAGVLGPQVGGSRRYDGPMGKSDRAFVFGALALWVGMGGATGLWLDGVLALIAVLLLATILRRCSAALKEGH